MVEMHFYGKLRRDASGAPSSAGGVVRLESGPDETIASLLKRVGVSADEVYHIFLNAKLYATRSTMAKWLRYRQLRGNPHDWNLDVNVKDGDRIGLFGVDMATLVV